METVIRELPDVTIISVAHRPSWKPTTAERSHLERRKDGKASQRYRSVPRKSSRKLLASLLKRQRSG